VERLEQIDQVIYQEAPREEMMPQVVELLRRVPAPDIQEVIKEVRIPTVEYVERVEETPQVHYEEVAQEVAVPQVIELLKQVPKHEYQNVEKPVEVPIISIQEKIVEVPEIFRTEVLKAVPKTEFWEVVKEHVEATQEFVQVQRTEVVPVPKNRTQRLNAPLYQTVEVSGPGGMTFVS